MDPLMVLWVFLFGVVFGIIAGLILVYRGIVSPLRKRFETLRQQKQSLSTVYGRITEQFAPFMESYPFSPQNFRFIGSPVDGIQFEDDRIVFVEFKTNKSRLTSLQQRIKRLIKDKRVEWFEFHPK
ncbi:MAG: endonuclease [Thermoplasmata archaeon]|nr:endonuclease [Thermoplasmata archaeon]